jgi:hypothetical protein
MYTIAREEIAAQHAADLQQQAAKQRLLRELRADRKPTVRRRRIWERLTLRRPRPAVTVIDTLDDRLRAAALYREGMLAIWQGDDEEACSLHGRSLHLARRAGDQTLIALALCGLARVALHEDLDWARALCEEALATVDGTGNPTVGANVLHVLSIAARMQGDLGHARRLSSLPMSQTAGAVSSQD